MAAASLGAPSGRSTRDELRPFQTRVTDSVVVDVPGIGVHCWLCPHKKIDPVRFQDRAKRMEESVRPSTHGLQVQMSGHQGLCTRSGMVRCDPAIEAKIGEGGPGADAIQVSRESGRTSKKFWMHQ